MNVRAWNDWYHVTVHAYGSWLRGDPRGWRSRHHREHVEGDYKRPPPSGQYGRLHDHSKSLMTREPVRLEYHLRDFVLCAMVERLDQDGIKVLIASLDSKHLHLLACFPDQQIRHWIGRAKKNASHLVRQRGLRVKPGGLWAKRCHAEPITGPHHHANTLDYIADHANRGAAVWRLPVREDESKG